MMKYLVFLLTALLFPSAAQAMNTSYSELLRQISPERRAELSVPVPSAPKAVKSVMLEQSDSGRYWVTASASNSRERTALLEKGLDIVEINSGSVSGFAAADTLRALSSEGLLASFRAISAARDFPSYDSAYHNYKETSELMQAIAAKNPDIASVFSIGKTVEGRDIWCLRFNTNAKGMAASSKPGAFFLGNHHAREHLSNEVPLLLAAWLMDNRNRPEIKKYLDSLDIFIIPMLNPDGVEYDISGGRYHMYRKNMSRNSDGSFGTDLNRNYDFLWCKYGSSNNPRTDTYCGKAAFSEPEAKAIRSFFAAHPNIKTHISYHTYGKQILYPYGGTYDEVPSEKDKKAFIKIGNEMAELTGYINRKSSDLYVSSGDSCDWAYKAHGVLAFTFELDGRDFYPSAGEIDAVVSKNIKAAVYLLGKTTNPYN